MISTMRLVSRQRVPIATLTLRKLCTATTEKGSFALRHPVVFGAGCSFVKMMCGDLLTQKVIEKRSETDWRRTAFFGFFGVFYMGGVQYLVYVKGFSYMFPTAERFLKLPLAQRLQDTRGLLEAMGQVAMDCCVHIPFLYFPAFLLLKDLMLNPDGIRVKGTTQASDILQTYKDEFVSLNVATCKFFIPSGIIMFGVVPMHLRIPYVACVGLVWASILSYLKGGDKPQMVPIDSIRELQELIKKPQEWYAAAIEGVGAQVDEEQFVAILAKADVSTDGVQNEAAARWLFKALDMDMNCAISGIDVKVLLALMAGLLNVQAEGVKFLFDSVDSDSDQTLTLLEVEAMMHAFFAVKERTSGKQLNLLFTFPSEEYNRNSRGLPVTYLKENAHERLQDFHLKYPAMKAQQLVLPECIAAEAKLAAKEVFAAADTNKDAGISISEFSAWLKSDHAWARSVVDVFEIYKLA